MNCKQNQVINGLSDTVNELVEKVNKLHPIEIPPETEEPPVDPEDPSDSNTSDDNTGCNEECEQEHERLESMIDTVLELNVMPNEIISRIVEESNNAVDINDASEQAQNPVF